MQTRRVVFETDAGQFAAEVILPDSPRVLAILLHGIPGAARAEDDAGYAGFAREIASCGFGALWFDMRGVRSSPGDFSIGGWRRDLTGAIEAVGRDPGLGSIPLVLIGSSAGGAVAIWVGAEHEAVRAVATLAAPAAWSFGSPDRLLAHFRNLGLIRDPGFPTDPGEWWDEFTSAEPEKLVASVAPRPLLVVHGDADDVVGYPHAERLFAAAAEPKELVRLPGGAHQLRRDSRTIDCLADWLGHLRI